MGKTKGAVLNSMSHIGKCTPRSVSHILIPESNPELQTQIPIVERIT